MEKKLTELAGELAKCQAYCNVCYDSCLKEKDLAMMVGCIRLDRECSEFCGTAMAAVTSGWKFTEEILRLCAEICEACAAECGKHHYQHCRDCAKVCKECAAACRSYTV